MLKTYISMLQITNNLQTLKKLLKSKKKFKKFSKLVCFNHIVPPPQKKNPITGVLII
jgi:hypothetical protein